MRRELSCARGWAAGAGARCGVRGGACDSGVLRGGFAFGGFADDVGLSLGVAASAGDGDAMDRRVGSAVAPRSRRWRLVLPELIGIGASPAERASLSLAKRLGAGDLADELGGGQRPESGPLRAVRRDPRDGSAISASSDLIVWVSSRSRQLVPRDRTRSAVRRGPGADRCGCSISPRTARWRAASAQARGRADATAACC